MNKNVDADFLALPLTAVSDAAISTAKDAGASHVDVRIERTRNGLLSLRDARPETQSDETIAGVGVRVIVNGAWGFASSPEISVDVAKKLALTAVAMAKPFLLEARKAASDAVLAYELFKSEDAKKRKNMVEPSFFDWPEELDFNQSVEYMESIGKMAVPASTPLGMKNTLAKTWRWLSQK